MYSALLIATGTSQHGARTCLCPVRHLGSNLALVSAIFIFCLRSVGDTLQPKRRGPKPLVDESALVEWLERGRQQGRPPTRDNIISEASRMYNDSVQTDDRPSTTLTLKSMEKWWRLFLRRHPEVSGRLAQHAESVRLDKKLTKDEWTTWFNESLGPALAKVGYDPQYVFNEDESGMFIDFDTGSLKVYVLRGTKTCARRRGYDRRHATLVACVRADGFYVRPALLWPSALTRGDLFQHEACPILVKATKTGVGASEQGKNAKKTLCRAKKHISKKKQGFCMKMERKHFAGPRNILQTKRQGFCVVFLSNLKIGPTGPTTGHWTENWSFYLMHQPHPHSFLGIVFG